MRFTRGFFPDLSPELENFCPMASAHKSSGTKATHRVPWRHERANNSTYEHDERRFFMFKRTLIAASLAVAALASAQSMAAVVGGGATLPEGLYNDSAFRPSTFDVYVGVGSGAGK